MISLKSRKTLPENIVIRLIHRSIHGQGVEGRVDSNDKGSYYKNMFPNHYINFTCDSCNRKHRHNLKLLFSYEISTGILIIKKIVTDDLSEIDSNQAESTNTTTYLRHRKFEVENKVKIRKYHDRFFLEITGDARYCVFVAHRPYIYTGDTPYHSMYSMSSTEFDYPGIIGDYTLYIIDINSGEICDERCYEADRMMLLENKCIQVCENTVAVLSLEHEKIHIYKIVNGNLSNIRVTGKLCFLNKAHYLNAVFADESDRQPCMDDLMHQLLDFLYRKATRTVETTNSTFKKETFAEYIDSLLKLKLRKMVHLDETHLLLKYSERKDLFEMLAFVPRENMKPEPEILVVYNIPRDEIRAVYTNQDLEDVTDDETIAPIFFSSILFNNLYSKLLQERRLVIYRKQDNID